MNSEAGFEGSRRVSWLLLAALCGAGCAAADAGAASGADVAQAADAVGGDVGWASDVVDAVGPGGHEVSGAVDAAVTGEVDALPDTGDVVDVGQIGDSAPVDVDAAPDVVSFQCGPFAGPSLDVGGVSFGGDGTAGGVTVKSLARRVGDSLYVELDSTAYEAVEGESKPNEIVVRVGLRVEVPAGGAIGVEIPAAGVELLAVELRTTKPVSWARDTSTLADDGGCVEVSATEGGVVVSLKLHSTLQVLKPLGAEPVEVEVAVSLELDEAEIVTKAIYDGQCQGYETAEILPVQVYFDAPPMSEWDDVEGDCDDIGAGECYVPQSGGGEGDRWSCGICWEDVCLEPEFQYVCPPPDEDP